MEIISKSYLSLLFKNNPIDVANYFYQILVQDGYAKHFEKIIFAIPQGSNGNLDAFKSVFKK